MPSTRAVTIAVRTACMRPGASILRGTLRGATVMISTSGGGMPAMPPPDCGAGLQAARRVSKTIGNSRTRMGRHFKMNSNATGSGRVNEIASLNAEGKAMAIISHRFNLPVGLP